MYFASPGTPAGQELWVSDGTDAGTRMVKDINPGMGNSMPMGITAVGGRLYFSADDGVHGSELWTSDGTEAGTWMLRDINPAVPQPGELGWPIGSHPEGFTALGDTVYFSAGGPDGIELWKTDDRTGD